MYWRLWQGGLLKEEWKDQIQNLSFLNVAFHLVLRNQTFTINYINTSVYSLARPHKTAC